MRVPTFILTLVLLVMAGCHAVNEPPVTPEDETSMTEELEIFFFGSDNEVAALSASASQGSKPRVLVFHDNFSANWDLLASTAWFEHCARREAAIEGSSDAYPSSTVWGYVCKEERTLFMETINDNPNGCLTHSDSFVLEGERIGHLTFGGTWTSYCDGEVLNTGSWEGTFDPLHTAFSVTDIRPRPSDGRNPN